MNEEKYTREKVEKSAKNKRVEPENKTTQKKHADKLKNETSAGESYRKKLRYGKKDTRLTPEEEKKLRKIKKQGRKRIYKETAAAESIRKAGIQNEDENVGTEAMDQAVGLAMAGSAEARSFAQDIRKSNYGKKLHARNEYLDAVQGARGAKEAGEAGESTMYRIQKSEAKRS